MVINFGKQIQLCQAVTVTIKQTQYFLDCTFYASDQKNLRNFASVRRNIEIEI